MLNRSNFSHTLFILLIFNIFFYSSYCKGQNNESLDYGLEMYYINIEYIRYDDSIYKNICNYQTTLYLNNSHTIESLEVKLFSGENDTLNSTYIIQDTPFIQINEFDGFIYSYEISEYYCDEPFFLKFTLKSITGQISKIYD